MPMQSMPDIAITIVIIVANITIMLAFTIAIIAMITHQEEVLEQGFV